MKLLILTRRKKFKNFIERQLTSEQQKKFISYKSIFSLFLSTLSQTASIEKSISIKTIEEQSNVLNLSIFVKKKQNKTSLLFSSNKKIRVVEKETKRLNYKTLNNSRQRDCKEELNVNKTYMYKTLQVLSVDKEFKLINNRTARTLKLSIIELQLY